MFIPSVRKYLGALAAAALVAVSAAPSADAADPNAVLDRIRASGELRIPVMIGEEPGYVRDRATGEWGGFYVEWAQQIADILGVSVTPVESTWGNLAADFQADRIDIAIGLNPNPQRGLVVDYLTIPLFTDAWAIVARPDFEAPSWNSLNDPGVNVVVQTGSTMQVVANNKIPQANITPVDTRPNGVLEINAGRADAMIVAIFDAVRISNETGLQVILPEPLLINPATIGLRRQEGNAGLMNWLTIWVNQQRALGLAQAKLQSSFEAHGLDMSVLPDNFSF